MKLPTRNFFSSTVIPKTTGFPVWAYEPPTHFSFEIEYTSKKSNARVGRIQTANGTIDTPGFVPVGTNGAMKALTNRDIRESGVQLMFANTYHLLLQPGTKIIRQAGGLHAFMNRTGETSLSNCAPQPPANAIITDSGGFQVFSMMASRLELDPGVNLKGSGKRHLERNATRSNGRPTAPVRVSEEGVEFSSYRDGSKVFLTPESSVQAQQAFGSDIIVPLDELLPYTATMAQVAVSMARTHRWEERSLREHLKAARKLQAMYGVVHGSTSLELRRLSLDLVASWPFDGWAIGGSLGTSRSDMRALLSQLGPLLSRKQADKGRPFPVHLLGIADPESVGACVQYGIDTFDSCYPTRVARHGQVVLPRDHREEGGERTSHLRLQHGRFRDDLRVISAWCRCSTCTDGHSRAYLNHLLRAREPAASTLLSVHNVHQMNQMMVHLRDDILSGRV